MKKPASVLMFLLSLVALFRVSVATHYCCGIEVASVVSLDAKLASCGMEKPVSTIPDGVQTFQKHCCENKIAYCGTDSNYFNSYTTLIDLFQQQTDNQSYIAFDLFNSRQINSADYFDTGPPGKLKYNKPELSGICNFRI